MNFDLGPDELALRDGIRGLCAGRFPIDRIRGLVDQGGVDRDLWQELGAAGVFSLRLPESEGGVGLGMTEAVIVFQELGRALVPGPLVGTHLAAGLVDGASQGEQVVTAIGHPSSPCLIEYGGESDGVLALGEGIGYVKGVGGDPVAPLDPLTPLLRVEQLGESRALAGDAAGLRLAGALLTSALAAGNAARTAELAVAYAKERVQFDRPIGAFQAVKHICADMFVRGEVARAAVDAAGVSFDRPGEDVRRVVATAKLIACEVALSNAKSCVQVHGGMGFTWEVDVHLYLKRAAVLATQFGGLDEQAELVAVSL